MLAHSFWPPNAGESTETKEALGWTCLHLPTAWASRSWSILKQKSSFMGGGTWKDATPLLQKFISQRKHCKWFRKELLEICLPYLAWNCNSPFLLMLYTCPSPRRTFSCWTATKEFVVVCYERQYSSAHRPTILIWEGFFPTKAAFECPCLIF